MNKQKQKKPLYRIAEASLKKAVDQAIRDHAKTGDKVVIYRQGKVVEVSAAKLLRLKKLK